VPIKMTSYGASKISFSAIIGLEDEQKAVAALYSEFFGNGKAPKTAVASVAKAVAAKKTKSKSK